ncbi:MAG: MFS transporter [Candidatus Sumerlaeota bacterium]|nr:MFS transporter [Candidatus Sumerlaeota bacterium]
MDVPTFPPHEPDRSLKISVIEGIFATIHGAIPGGALVTGYALMLGANDFHLSVVSALGAIATLGAIVSAQVVARLGQRKALSVFGGLFSRGLWLPLGLLPFLGLSPGWSLLIFFALILLAGLAMNLSSNAWLSWMTDLTPSERRGRYFGLRNTLMGVVSMAVGYGAGKLYDILKAHGAQRGAFLLFFGIAVAAAAIAAAIQRHQYEPHLKSERLLTIAQTLRLPLAHRGFRRFLLFITLWAMALGVAGPFWGAHMIKNLKMPFSTIAVYSIISGVSGLALQPLWGKVIDRLGNRPVMAFNVVCVFFLPLIWLFATPDFYLPIWIDAFLTGVFWPGFNLAAFNMVLTTAPRENRSAYLAVNSMASGFSAFLASLVGGCLAYSLSQFYWRVGAQTFVNFHVLFLLSALGRLALLPMALGLHEDKAHPVRAIFTLAGAKLMRGFEQKP